MAREGDVAGYRRGDGIAADQAGDNILGPALCGARIDEGLVLGRHRHRFRCDGQGAVGRVHGELCRHVVVRGVLHHRSAADGVRQVTNIRAARVACRQATHRVIIAFHHEIQCLKSGCALHRSVIHIARAALGHHCDSVFLRTVVDGQFAFGRFRKSIVRGDIRLTRHHLEVIGVATVVIRSCRRQCAVCRRVSNGCRVSAQHIVERVCRIAVLHSAVVFDCRVRNAHGHRSRVDGQGADRRCHQIVAHFSLGACCHRHAVHRCNNVRMCAVVGDSAGGGHCHHEGVRVSRLKGCGCEAALCQCCAVVGLVSAVGGDGHLLPRHLKGAVYVADIVAGGHIHVVAVLDHRHARNVVARPYHCLTARHGHTLDVVV